MVCRIYENGNLDTLDSLPKSNIQWRGRMFSIQNQRRRKMLLRQPWNQNFIFTFLLPYLSWTETPHLNSNFKRDVLRFNIFSLESIFSFYYFLFSFFYFLCYYCSSNLSPHSKKKKIKPDHSFPGKLKWSYKLSSACGSQKINWSHDLGASHDGLTHYSRSFVNNRSDKREKLDSFWAKILYNFKYILWPNELQNI